VLPPSASLVICYHDIVKIAPTEASVTPALGLKLKSEIKSPVADAVFSTTPQAGIIQYGNGSGTVLRHMCVTHTKESIRSGVHDMGQHTIGR
jgi:hypothetical protein